MCSRGDRTPRFRNAASDWHLCSTRSGSSQSEAPNHIHQGVAGSPSRQIEPDFRSGIGTPVPTFRTRACHRDRAAKIPLAASRQAAGLYRRSGDQLLVSTTSVILFDASSAVHLRSPFPKHLTGLPPASSRTARHPTIGAAQLAVVWTLILQSESEAPTLISCAAKLLEGSCI
jgi:hypothetical protein